MARALPDLIEGDLTFRPQSEIGATYARKIDKSETRIDWSLDADAIRNHIHGLSPSPGAYSEIDLGRGPERVKIPPRGARRRPSARRGERDRRSADDRLRRGAMRILEAQRAGKSAMSGAEFQRGAQIMPGARFHVIGHRFEPGGELPFDVVLARFRRRAGFARRGRNRAREIARPSAAREYRARALSASAR